MACLGAEAVGAGKAVASRVDHSQVEVDRASYEVGRADQDRALVWDRGKDAS